MTAAFPKCNDSRECSKKNGDKCTILTSTYLDGECPFRKAPRRKGVKHVSVTSQSDEEV